MHQFLSKLFHFVGNAKPSNDQHCSQCQKRQLIDPDDIWNYGVGDKALYRQAKSGEVEAQYLVGYYFWQGENGFEQNHIKAEDWLKKASQQGHLKAKEALAQAQPDSTRL